MVRPRTDEQTPDPDVHRIPSLPKDLMEVYNGMQKLGATGPSSGRSVEWLSKQLHHPKKEMLHELHVLEGKGIAGHQTSGHETAWYLRK